MYSDLLLPNGRLGPDACLAPVQNGEAHIFIGIGGVGVEALGRIKHTVYTRLRPDAGETYSRIRFLAIDTDFPDYDERQIAENITHLQSNERFSIAQPHLGAAIAMDESNTEWMSRSEIVIPGGPLDTRGIRQAGRYCLMKRADVLRTKIRQLAYEAAAGIDRVTFHILAGIAGGTGSGGFLDTCYIIRSAMDEVRMNSSLLGYLFLPDILFDQPNRKRYMQANGYAFLRELDYLMNLRERGEYFEQNYGSFSVKTQAQPVDLCFLVSGKDSDGHYIPDARERSMESVCEYVSAYLTNVPDDFREHLANLYTGITLLNGNVTDGAARKYCAFGISGAELPWTHMAAYMYGAAYKRMQPYLFRSADDNMARKTAEQLELSREGFTHRLMRDVPTAPDFDRTPLPAQKTTLDDSIDWPQHGLDAAIAEPINLAFNQADSFLHRNLAELTAEPDSYDTDDVHVSCERSVAAEVFKALTKLAADPSCGPRAAAGILRSEMSENVNLLEILSSVKMECSDILAHMEEQSKSCEGRVRDCAAAYNRRILSKKKYFEEYLNALTEWYRVQIDVRVHRAILQLVACVYLQLTRMYKEYFAPLCRMLENLDETFGANLSRLNDSVNALPHGICRRMFEVGDVQPRLDGFLAAQDIRAGYREFMQFLFAHYESWKDGNDYRISRCVNMYMQTRFYDLFSSPVDLFLSERFGTNDHNVLAYNARPILEKVVRETKVCFPADAIYTVEGSNTCMYNTLSVPVFSAVLTAAAQNLQQNMPDLDIRNDNAGGRVVCIKLWCGLPLYAYAGLREMREAYDETDAKGLHLHEADVNWRETLPPILPYSRWPQDTPFGEEREALYHRAAEAGVIGPRISDVGEWFVRQIPDTAAITEKYPQNRYYITGMFDEKVRQQDLEELEEARAALLAEADGITFYDDFGWETENARPRIDRFVSHRAACEAARTSLDNLARFDEFIQTIRDLKA